jgi:hypothetical protein
MKFPIYYNNVLNKPMLVHSIIYRRYIEYWLHYALAMKQL